MHTRFSLQISIRKTYNYGNYLNFAALSDYFCNPLRHNFYAELNGETQRKTNQKVKLTTNYNIATD